MMRAGATHRRRDEGARWRGACRRTAKVSRAGVHGVVCGRRARGPVASLRLRLIAPSGPCRSLLALPLEATLEAHTSLDTRSTHALSAKQRRKEKQRRAGLAKADGAPCAALPHTHLVVRLTEGPRPRPLDQTRSRRTCARPRRASIRCAGEPSRSAACGTRSLVSPRRAPQSPGL